VQWSLEQAEIEVIHYLDDFMIISSSEKTESKRALELFLKKCRKLGVPIPDYKTDKPAITITFLGIELDTVTQTM